MGLTNTILKVIRSFYLFAIIYSYLCSRKLRKECNLLEMSVG